MEITKTIVTAM